MAATQMSVTSTFEMVTPEMATTWLALNERNRTLNKGRVNQLSAAIQRGEWRVNGEAIKFNGSGALLDGQHRLAAIVASGIPVTLLVIRGVSYEAQETMDGGLKRTLSDKLTIRGEKNTAALAGALRLIYLYEHFQTFRNTWNTATDIQYLFLLEQSPAIREAARYSRRVRGLTPSYETALRYLSVTVAPEDAPLFWEHLVKGDQLPVSSPIYVLRERLINEAEKAHQQRSAPAWERAAWFIKAFNAWMAGEEIRLLKYRVGGAKPEQFPVFEVPRD